MEDGRVIIIIPLTLLISSYLDLSQKVLQENASGL